MKKAILSAASIFLCALALSSASPSWAAGEQPGGACTAAGQVVRTSGPDQIPYRTLVCNGSTWTLSDERTTTGRSLFRVGNDAAACDATKLGRLRFNTSTDKWSYCHASTWKDLGLASCEVGQSLMQGASGPECCPKGDGATWITGNAAAANQWEAIAYGNGTFVAVSSSGAGSNRVMTSPDGITWTIRTAAAANSWYDVAFGNGIFVAISWDGTNRVMTSPDGITWTAQNPPEANSWQTIAFGNGVFVIASSNGTNRIMTSPDGVTWTPRTSGASVFYDVTYGAGLFVLVGNGVIRTSPDGVTWTGQTSPQANPWITVTYGNGMFVAFSIGGGTQKLMTSPDGITWTGRIPPSSSNGWGAVTYGNGRFVALAQSSGTDRSMTSTDGITWTTSTSIQQNMWREVIHANGGFVGVSYDGTNRVAISPDTPCP